MNTNQHWYRRFIHVCIASAPLLYYGLIEPNVSHLGLSTKVLLTTLGISLMGIETLRLAQGVLFFGQREYERKYPSAAAWTGLGIILVFLYAPEYKGHSAAFGLPIIWCLALGDPLLGECRLAGMSQTKTILITLLCLSSIWLFACLYFSLPYWIILLLPGLAILAEWPNLRWVDDNFMMMFVPLLFVRFIF